MKKLILCIFIATICLIAGESIAQTTMKSVYNSRFFVVDQNADSTYNAFGINSSYLHFLTLNSNLDIIKEKKINSTFALSGYRFKKFNDSIILYVNNAGVYASMYCMNKNGTGKWMRGFSLTNGMFTYVTPLLVTNNPTRYWFSGVYGLNTDTYPVLFSLDSAGNFMDVNGLVSTTQNFQIADMVKLNDGNMIAIGTYSRAPDYTPLAIVIKLTPSGKLIWTRTYNTYIDYYGNKSFNAPSVFSAIRSYNTGNIVIAGSSTAGNLKITIDENGAVVHADYFKEGLTEGNTNAFRLNAQEYGILSSIPAPSAASADISFKMVNTGTNYNWARNYNWVGGSLDVPQTVIKTMDGGYLISGLTDKGISFGGANYTSLYKVNNGGLNGCNGNTVNSGGPFLAAIYPLQGGSDSIIQFCHDSTIVFENASLPASKNFTYGTGTTTKELQCSNAASPGQWLSLIFPKVVNAQMKSGSTATISWGSANLPAGANGLATLKIEYSIDGGSNWKLIALSIPALVNSYTWSIPKDSSADCKIKITCNENNAFADTSQVSFTMKPEINPYIAILYPNGGEEFQPGATVVIKWDAPIVTEKIKIVYTTSGGRNIFTIDAAANNTGTYSWVVPNVNTDSAMVQLSGQQSIYSFYAQSGYLFKIKGTTGIEPNPMSPEQISIYPNPANHEINIISKEKVLGVKIFSLNGTLLHQSVDQKISLDSFASGIYIISVQTEKGVRFQKFVKEN